jgi:hypothetical protein
MMHFNNFFVNVANMDNGKNWSTPWVIDDPTLYVIPPRGQSVENLTGRSSVARRGGQSGRTALWKGQGAAQRR